MSASVYVNPLSILFMCVSALICFGVPIALMIWARVKYKKAFSFLPLLGGALGFIISQLLLRIPLMTYVFPLFDWYKQFMQTGWIFTAVACFTAGLFEEPARFIVFTIMKKHRQFPDGLSYGIGHGGIEAILLVGINTVVIMLASIVGNINNSYALLFGITSAQLTSFADASPILFLSSGIERLFAVAIHIGLSILVLMGFQNGKRVLYLLLSIIAHGFANFIPVALLPMLGITNPWIIDAVIALEAAVAVWFTVVQAKKWHRSLKAEEGAPHELTGQTNTP